TSRALTTNQPAPAGRTPFSTRSRGASGTTAASLLGENERVEAETRYARSGEINIAYQVSGEGPFDLVFVPGYVTHLELAWRIPSFAPALRALGSFCRLIRFDKRGTGMSVPVSGAPTLETRMDDVRAVM